VRLRAVPSEVCIISPSYFSGLLHIHFCLVKLPRHHDEIQSIDAVDIFPLRRKNAEEALQGLNGSIIGKQTVRLSWGRNPANKQVLT
jgi:hypothetical protein